MLLNTAFRGALGHRIAYRDAATGEPVVAVIVEPQGRDDADKQYSWPAYVTNVRRAAKCPRAVLVVICPDSVEGEKCRKGIPTGHPGFDLLPIVVDPLHAPSTEGASPWLVIFDACLGVLDMGTEPGARRILNAVQDSGTSAADRKRLITLILEAAPAAARQILEDLLVRPSPDRCHRRRGLRGLTRTQARSNR